MGFHALVNTRYFSEAAIDFKKNGNRYTTAPKGSRDYFQYWEEQEKRCKFGYKVGDLWIPGRFYFYLNFFPIYKVPDHIIAKCRRRPDGTVIVPPNAEKEQSFPKFWEIDYEWWNFKHIAWYGGDFMGIKSDGGKHMCCLKTRGAGFSYKEAADGVYNYVFIPGSKSYYFAGAMPYLVGDAIMDKVQQGLDWVNDNSSYWKQNRQKKFSIDHQRASYIDAGGVERGTMSEIIAQVVDKPSKTRGKRGRKASFEEFGSFPHSEDALEVCLGSMRDGSVYVGQVTVFGTGGEQGPGIQGLENIFSSPETWDMLKFPNVWEQGMQNTECGYFVPSYRANSWYMDEDGNVDVKAAVKADQDERDKKASSGKPKDLDRRMAEYPWTPSEALQRLTGNGFNVAELNAQIKKVQSSQAIQSLLRHGTIVTSDTTKSGVEFQILPKTKAKPIEKFPHNSGDDLEGCFTVLQRPYLDANGNVPPGMYVITFDSYYKDETQDTTSLFSFKVWKQFNEVDTTYEDLPVAWFAGRRKDLNEIYQLLFYACRLYNAQAQGEISGGGQGVVTYAKTYRLLHWLKNEPEMAHNKELASKSAGNSFLMNMAAERKKMGLQYLESWHDKPRGSDEKGNPVLNLHLIYDVAFLMEMAKHNPESGNYDRISDAIIAMFELKERVALMLRTKKKTRSFYKRSLFGAGTTQYQGTTTSY